MSGTYIVYPTNGLTGSVSLTGQVSGVLPIANGGTAVSALGTTTESASAVLTLTSWSGAVIHDTTIQVKKATAAQDGYLSAADFALFAATSSGSSTISVGALDGANPSSRGAVIGTASLFMQSATAVFPGLVSSAAQTFAGVKTFNSAPNFASLSSSAPLRTDSSSNVTVGSISLVADVTGNLPLSQTSGSLSLVNRVVGNLPLTQTSGSLSLINQVVGNLPLSQTSGSISLTNQVANSLPLSQTTGSISLVDKVVGNLPVTNLNSGTSADGTTFWRGDSIWAVPTGTFINPMNSSGDIIISSGSGNAVRLPVGTGFQVLSIASGSLVPSWNRLSQPTITVYSTPGDYIHVCSASHQFFKITLVGGGGGGGGTASAAAQSGAGAGGAGGATVVYVTVKTLNQMGVGVSIPFTVGIGGAGGGGGNNSGTAGSQSSGGIISGGSLAATGGAGGGGSGTGIGPAWQNSPSNGGTGSGNMTLAVYSINGGYGTAGQILSSTQAAGGSGGGSSITPPTGIQNNDSVGFPGLGPGGGGGGGVQRNNAGTQAGGAGSSGIVIIEAFSQ